MLRPRQGRHPCCSHEWQGLRLTNSGPCKLLSSLLLEGMATLGAHGDSHSCLLTPVQGLVLRSGGCAYGTI